AARWEAWEREYIRGTRVDFKRNLETMDSLYEHAKALGALERVPLAGLETIIRIARVVNV
ncbi:MAG: hypothetical protein QGG73_12635, partial [Candidatus Hydrogenedentes bacterium]|nr:hypothetical protein [Candidatus Hydrogenedentota bacterium]